MGRRRIKKTKNHIACPVINQEARPSEGNQSEVEKSVPGTNSSTNNEPLGHQNRNTSNIGPANSQTNKPTSGKRTPWTREEYSQVMKSFYSALERPTSNTTNTTYGIWRNAGGDDISPYIDAGKLANVRRDIIRNNRLTHAELEQIKQSVISDPNFNDELRVEGSALCICSSKLLIIVRTIKFDPTYPILYLFSCL